MSTENQTTEQTMPVEKQKLEITPEISDHLVQTGKWAKFLAILGFVFMGLMVFIGFGMGIIMSFLPGGQAGVLPFPSFIFGFIYLIFAAIYFFPILYLFRFSTGIKQALLSKNQKQLVWAFGNLKSHYRFVGILMIVMLAFYAVVFVVMMFAGLFAGLSGLGTLAA